MAYFDLAEIRSLFEAVMRRGELEGFSAKARERAYDPEQEEGADVSLSGASIFPLEPEGGEAFVGVDGSSRILDSFIATIAVAAATAVDRHGNVYVDVPSIRGRIMESSVPFAALAFDVDPGDLEKRIPAWVTTKNPNGQAYHRDYYRIQMAHEIRTFLETEVLGRILRSAGPRILVDGPVYPLPGFLFGQRVRKEYREAFEELIDRRLRVLKGLESRVIGVVKRLDLAHWISSSDGAEVLVGVPCRGLNDLQVMQLVAERLRKKGMERPFKAHALGPVVVDPLDASFPRKYMYYLAVPSRPYEPATFSFLRLEALFDLGEDLVRILGDFSERLAPLPLSVVAADRRSRRIVRSVASRLYSMLRGAGVAFTYETNRMMEAMAWA